MTDDSKDEVVMPEHAGLSASSEFVQIFLIQIDITSASNLIKADTFGKSDPYCKVSAFGQSYTTAAIMKNLDPTWNETTSFCFFEDPKALHFEVWDWDKNSKDDAIGDHTLSLDGFYDPNHNGFSGNVDLQNVKKGQLNISVGARKLLPLELENRAKRLQEETAQQQQTIEDRTAAIDTLTQENAALTSDNARLTNENIVKTGEKKRLEENLAELKNQSYGLNLDVDRLTGIVEGMQGTLDEERKDTEVVAGELNEVNQQADRAMDDERRLTAELESLRQELSAKQAENERARVQRERQAAEAERERVAAESEKNNSNSNKKLVGDDEPTTPLVEKPTKTGDSDTKAEEAGGPNTGCQCCTIL
jgi:hypothetical protein